MMVTDRERERGESEKEMSTCEYGRIIKQYVDLFIKCSVSRFVGLTDTTINIIQK